MADRSSASQTPMMRQYHAIRRELPENTFLLFRLGDFYEMFFDDAIEAAAILNVALTKRGDIPMCGVPYHSAKGYIEKLIAAGRKAAICDQVGEVQQGKLVRRELTQIISVGTMDDGTFESGKPVYVGAANLKEKTYGLAWCDLGTGEFRAAQFERPEELREEISRLGLAELLVPSGQSQQLGDIRFTGELDAFAFDTQHAEETLRSHFHTQSLDGFGLRAASAAIAAAGATLFYLGRQLRRKTDHIRSLSLLCGNEFVGLDPATQSHLEIAESRAGKSMTLLSVLDRTLTPMGSRRLRDWLLHPLRNVEPILERQDAIEWFTAQPLALGRLRSVLESVRDLERAASRLSQGTGCARDLAALKTSLSRIPALRSELQPSSTQLPRLLDSLAEALEDLPDLTQELNRALLEELPPGTRDGGMIREGYDLRLDELRSGSKEGKQWVAELQEREIERTGIKSLKVRFNSVFGYFIEITKANLAAVPADYIRKQTTVNGERFVTPELKEMEAKILGADEKSKALEAEIFQLLRSKALDHLPSIQSTASSLAGIDALASLAETARLYQFMRPVVDASGCLEIRDGRHPVLDQVVTDCRFVPNDTDMDLEAKRMAIITGPNMAGKSTYIRQVALLVLLAQVGSFLPCKSARIGVVDRIFTRVGASDDLARGQSTFMVEMNEAANIVNNATSRSLVVLDEIGRGTSTFDGLSIAWSIAEHLHDRVGCRTLFATHYHELTDLARTRPAVRNWNVAVREWNNEIVFLRRIVPGAADQSYGIHVAKLAGLPDAVILRAQEILQNLEKAELNADGKPTLAASRRQLMRAATSNQLDLFASAEPETLEAQPAG